MTSMAVPPIRNRSPRCTTVCSGRPGTAVTSVLLDPQPGARVGGQQRAEPGRVQVVGVLVRNQYRVEITDVIEPGQDARVEQHPGVADLGEQAGMAQVRQPHRGAPPGGL